MTTDTAPTLTITDALAGPLTLARYRNVTDPDTMIDPTQTGSAGDRIGPVATTAVSLVRRPDGYRLTVARLDAEDGDLRTVTIPDDVAEQIVAAILAPVGAWAP